MKSVFTTAHILAEITEYNVETFLFAIESLMTLNHSQKIYFCCYCSVFSLTHTRLDEMLANEPKGAIPHWELCQMIYLVFSICSIPRNVLLTDWFH